MRKKILPGLLFALFAGLAVYSGFQIVTALGDYRAGLSAYEALQELAVLPEQPAVPEASVPATAGLPAVDWPIIDFDALSEVNPDVVGWICIEGTPVNYPIVQGPDNQFYLRRLPDGKANTAGSIFMDCRNASGFTDRNTLIYGHNMKNGSMFAALSGYQQQEFYDAHPTVLITTPEGNYSIQLFSGYVASLRDRAWQTSFPSDAAYAQWLLQAKARSLFSSDVTPTARDRVVTLSTCSYAFADARFVLIGVLTQP